MKKIWKRLGAVLMTAAMALGLMAGAGAANDTAAASVSSQAAVTVSNLAAGDELSAYRLVSYNDSYHDYIFDSNFETFVNSYDGLPAGTAKDKLAACTNVTKLLEDYVANHTLPGAFTTANASDAGSATLTLNPGYYLLLVKTTAANSMVYQPMSVFAKVEGDKLLVYGGDSTNGQEDALTLAAKSEEGPVIEKRVNTSSEWGTTASAGVGDTAAFYVKVTLPKYQDITTMEMALHDTMIGMKYKNDSLKVYTAEPDDNGDFNADNLLTANVVAEPTGNYVNGQQALTFALDYNGLMANEAAQKTIWIYYEAVVQPEAADGANVHSATNTAYLSYNTAVNNNQQTADASTTVYNYEFKLNKRTEDQDTSLAGAKFTLYSDAACTNSISFVKSGSYYRPATATDADAAKVTEIDADFLIAGLNAGIYYVKETTTPRGFFEPAGAFKLELTADKTGTVHNESLSGAKSNFSAVSEADDGLIAERAVNAEARGWQYVVILKNNSTPLLPTTGGPGTVAISIAGVLLMILGAALYMGYRKKRAQN